MKFDELKLCMAIQKADLGGGDRPSTAKRLESAAAVMNAFLHLFEDSVFPYSIDDIERWRLSLRKQADTQIKIAVASAHGTKCFWNGRNKGLCSDDVECGHLVARSDGGDLTIANCVIECRSHNNQRRAMTIEEYITSDLMAFS